MLVGKQPMVDAAHVTLLAVAKRKVRTRVATTRSVRTGRLEARYRPARARDQRLVNARQTFGTWLRRWTPPGINVETSLEEGRRACTFLQVAAELKAHVIVMGTQHFSGWQRYRAAGAVSRILAATPCPILSIPQPPGGGLPSAVTPSPVPCTV